MGPKKGRSGPAAKPAAAPPVQIHPAELKQARDAYQQAQEKNGKKLSDSIDRLRLKDTHMSRITILRLLLDKRELLKDFQNEPANTSKNGGYANWLRGQLASFSKEHEHPLPGDARMSCTLVTALGCCWRHYVAQKVSVSATDQQLILDMLVRSLEKGFSKDNWSKDWVDPRSEMITAEELKVPDHAIAFVAERTNSTYMLADQYKQLTDHYMQLYTALNGSHWLQYPTPAHILRQPSAEEARALAAEAKATAEQPKQLDPKLVQQETLREQQQLAARNEQQQTARGSRRDTDRRDRDVKRSAGKEADDLVKAKELPAARLAEKKLQEHVNKLLDHLEARLLRPGQQLDKQQQLVELGQMTAHKIGDVSIALKKLNNAKDSPEAEIVLKQCKHQFGDVNPSEAALLSQLEGLNSSSGYVFLDEVLIADSSSGPSSRKQHTWDTLEAFEEHVCATHLSREADHCNSVAFDSSSDPPKLCVVYAGEFGDRVSDDDDHHVMNGVNGHVSNGLLHNRKWLETFGEECPLVKLLDTFETSVTEECLTEPPNYEPRPSRVFVASGFALLQLQLGAINPDPVELSQQQPWVLLAYHTLKMLPALFLMQSTCQDFIIYNYWLTQSASADDYGRITSADTDAYPDSTQGAVGDIITILQMLHEAQLLRGPLLLAVQLYLLKHGGAELAMDDLADRQYMAADKVVNCLGEREQNDLRIRLFQVLYHVFASLPCYRQFLRALLQHVHRPAAVAVQRTDDDKGARLSLWPPYWEQACRSASTLVEHHTPCCNSHVTLRTQSEARGEPFSRFDLAAHCETFVCSDDAVIQALHSITSAVCEHTVQEDDRVAQRYLVEASYVMQAQQRQHIEIGTREGLKALLDQLYLGPDRHPLMSKIGVQPAAEPNTPKRSAWDKARTDLLIAQQLAMYRQQLAKLIQEHSRRLEAHRYRLTEQEVHSMIRALFCQRAAGRHWVLYHFQQLFEQQQKQLLSDERQLQYQLRTLSDGTEHKTNKSVKADNSKEKEKDLDEKLQRCHKGIAEIGGQLANVNNLLANQGSEAESYPDLLRARDAVATGQMDPLKQMLQVLCSELVNDSTNACAQLEDALRMSRQMLFELDSLIMKHVLSARKRVILSAWAHKEVPVAVLLAAESLKMELERHKQDANLLELMEMDNKDKEAVQQQPSSKKKKKKKGPAQKPAAARRAAAQPDSDQPEEEGQQEAAADQEEQQQEDGDQQRQQQADSDEEDMVDIMSLPIFNRSRRGQRDDSGSSNPPPAAAADSRDSKGAAATRSEAPAGLASNSSKPVSVTAQQLEIDRHIYYGSTPICGRCGDIGHRIGDCRTAHCRSCGKWGHNTSWCESACSNCGRKHHSKRPSNERCTLRGCTNCHLMGHVAHECPSVTCHKCGLMGHKPTGCLGEVHACKQCRQPWHEGHECVRQLVQPAQAEQPTPPAAATATSERRASSRDRPASSQQQQAAGLGGKVLFAAAHVKLMKVSTGELAKRRENLVSLLFERDGGYATSLVSLEDKQSVLARIPDRDIAHILKQPNVAALLDEVYSRNQRTQSSHRKSDGASASVQPAAATQADQQQQRLGRRTSREAEQRAPAATSNRDAGDGRPPQLHPRTAAAASAATVPAGARQHLEAADTPVAAAHDTAASSMVSSAGDSVQAALSAADQLQPRPPPSQQQMAPAPKQPHPLYAQPAAARPEAVNLWSTTQQPPPTAAAAAGRQGSQVVLDLSGPLESWMCCFKLAAVQVIEQLVSEADIKQQLLHIVAATQEDQLAKALDTGLWQVLKQLHSSGAGSPSPSEGLLSFASLVAAANKLKPPVQPRLTAAPGQEPPSTPPPAAAVSAAVLAPSLVLPPHLQHFSRSQQQQQPGGMLPYPQQAAVPPPAAVLQLLGAPLALPVQQQQQPPAADPAAVPQDNQSDSEDEMLNSLIAHDSAGASQQPSSMPVWASTQPQQQHSMISSEFPSLGASAPGSRVGPAVSSAGLANETGEYNCFLNVVVQCLYSCKAFREQVRALPPYQQGNPVVHALLQLFEQMKAAEQGWKPGHDRTVVNPTELREALDSATQFRRQQMNDANELIDCLFECFKAAQGTSNVTGSRGVLIDSVFGLKVNEKVRCTIPGCGVVSHVVGSRWEHLVMVNSMALGYAAADARYEYDLAPDAPLDLGRLLRVLVDQEQKACDKDLGGCGELYAPEKECEQSPRVLSLQMVWDPDISGAEIGTALEHILEDVDISAMYAAGVANSDTTYHLSSAVAYYGQHYMAFVRNEKLNQWLIFDDASVNVVGSWEDVKRKCVNGRIQPSVLFYQAMDLAALPDRATASLSTAQPTAAAAQGATYHPVHGAYAATEARLSAANAGGQWGPAPSVVPHPMHLMQHRQQPQQQDASHPAAHVSSGTPPFIAQHDAAAATGLGQPPPAAAAGPWATAGPHASDSNGNLTTANAAAAPGWSTHNGSATDAWGGVPAASTPYPAAAAAAEEALSAPPAAAGVRSAQPRPAWGGAGRVAQAAFGGIAFQAARGEGGPTAASGSHRGQGAARGRGRR